MGSIVSEKCRGTETNQVKGGIESILYVMVYRLGYQQRAGVVK